MYCKPIFVVFKYNPYNKMTKRSVMNVLEPQNNLKNKNKQFLHYLFTLNGKSHGSQKIIMVQKDPSGPLRTPLDSLGHLRTTLDPSEPLRISQDPLESFRIP